MSDAIVAQSGRDCAKEKLSLWIDEKKPRGGNAKSTLKVHTLTLKYDAI